MMEKESTLKAEAVCPGKLELAQVKDKLARAKSGPQYWRSLEELAQTDGFFEMLHREFPRQASVWPEGASRRDFLKLMSASMALAGLSACVKQPLEPIVPYVKQPHQLVLGKPLFFASTMPFAGYGLPVIVESHEGRPTKIEGNPDHPASQGGTDVFMQASILDMYDPDRSQNVTYAGEIRDWQTYVGAISGPLNSQRAVQGAGLRILTRTVTSPTFASQMSDVMKAYPQAKWIQWEPLSRDNARAGAQMAFGQYVDTRYQLDKADIILALDGDFLSSGYPGFLLYARQFSSRRNPDLKEKMSRFYSVQSTPTNTSGKADHGLPVRASEVEQIARAIAAGIGMGAMAGGQPAAGPQKQFVDAVVKDLKAHQGTVVVIPGENQPASVHALAHAMNQALGAAGNTVAYTEPVEAKPMDQLGALKELVDDMNAGKVDLLMIVGGNPVYDAPQDLQFGQAMNKVALRVQHSLFRDETTDYCHWHTNGTHYLEQWGDARAIDGTVSLIQPLIAPLYDGRSDYEFLQVLVGQPAATSFDIVQRYWQGKLNSRNFDADWRKALYQGYVPNTAAAVTNASAKTDIAAGNPIALGGGVFEIILRRDPMIYDGTYANNAWLQETPKPPTQVCWDNAVLMSVATAEKLKLETQDAIEIEVNGSKVKGAIWRTPGHPDNCITVSLGYGRKKIGRVGNGVGFNAYELRFTNGMYMAPGKVKKTGEQYLFANPQGFQYIDYSDLPPGSESLKSRHIVRSATLEDFIKNPNFAHEEEGEERIPPELTLYPNYKYTEAKWGMAIDMNSCVGCKTCVVACQAENNIPIVGKEQVKRGRIMHWLRVDSYYEGGTENPKTFYQPVPCMQCENAPCEQVCPVGATVHSTEGLNDMVYNRCVGTRYCSNNCPYKVRRFNFLLWNDWDTEQYKLMRNPEVSVRSRGVMEKCTYCVQRISHGRYTAEKENRAIKDGEVITACQQACPADAIVFGDLNDPNSRVAKLQAHQRNYGLLADLNTRPRTTYLAVVRNPNPELEQSERS
jgi:molybdopterin-containing oxidoreductase family iron-sulfur binding subunit